MGRGVCLGACCRFPLSVTIHRRCMNHPYLPVLVFFGIALAIPVGSLVLARVWMQFFTPIKQGKVAGRQTRFNSQYYMFGLLFLLFDVETVFLLPFAVGFLDMSVGAFLVAMLFILLLAEGLVWAWSKGLLNWRVNSQPNYKAYGDR